MEYVPAKTIITRTKGSRWFGTDYNMNIYRGCAHGCIYCDSRSECYHVDDFGTVRAKEDALRVIRDDLRRKVRRGVIGTGAMSDPYNPFEKELLLTRHALELVSAYEFGACIATKSDLIVRDIDVLKEIKSHSPVIAQITVTCADDALAAKLEPFAPSPSRRFAALRSLSEAGIFCGVLLMPVLPWIEDSDDNIARIVQSASDAGARFVYPGFGVTLRDRQREYFYGQLDRHFPGLRQKYEERFGPRYGCSSPRAAALRKVFEAQCDDLGVLCRMTDIIRAYRLGYWDSQLSFL